ncbi:putative inositol 5-phosphatase [Aspergillus novofumigatus IBT 16806]|uniref:Putative rab small monomeric GTPase Rab7 n=1 Tax=Aspergillus novofumigatus (strain IBT 16806) TaxID=1392255 RepID=A0A2I1CHE8_ASPN1|nr:putative rab small monomeric GTPase Rab7 [Aspergillus novofumigatus IBT 16806]PKX97024.1 putative rab small monomeric GTPase Rab7 [Aspergillus novofumigatus IBT 16806]
MDKLTLYILTFNCARNPIDIELFASHFFHALPHTVPSAPPHLIVLSLQELAPIAYAFLGGSYLTPYFTSFRQVVDRAAASRWEDAQYVTVVEDHVGMTGLMVFARSDVVGRIASVQTAHVGLGLQQMGNKGAVGARLGWMVESESEAAETPPVPVTFVAAHLAPAEDAFERRNEDWRGLVERLVFSTTTTTNQEEDSESAALLGSSTTGEGEGEGVFTAGYLFLAGDLNYRTSNTLPQQADFARFPQLDVVDASDPLHYSRLLREDQLTREREKNQCFQGLSEAPITFPPTYKYKLGARNPRQWKFVHSRWPSWCDRILYLESSTATVTPYRYDVLPLFPTSDHRAVALAAAAEVLRSAQAGPSDSEAAPATDVQQQQQQQPQPTAPFPIDRDWKRKRAEARRKELVVGGLAYLGLTWEGRRYLVGMVIGGLGAWFVLRSMLSV